MIMSAQQVSCTLCSSLKYKSSNNALQAAWYSKIFQVVVLSCVLMIQVINGITSSNVSFNALLQTNEPQEPFQVHSNGFSWIIIFIFYEALSPIPLAIFGFSDKLFCAALLTSLGQNQDPLPLHPPLHRHQHLHHLQQHLIMDSQVVRVLGGLQLRSHISSSEHLLKWSVHWEKV